MKILIEESDLVVHLNEETSKLVIYYLDSEKVEFRDWCHSQEFFKTSSNEYRLFLDGPQWGEPIILETTTASGTVRRKKLA